MENILALIVENESETGEIVLMASNESPIVGKPYQAQFFCETYRKDTAVEMRINGRIIESEKGLGRFIYTPKSAGMKYFKASMRLKNPYTGKIEDYTDTFEIPAIE